MHSKLLTALAFAALQHQVIAAPSKPTSLDLSIVPEEGIHVSGLTDPNELPVPVNLQIDPEYTGDPTKPEYITYLLDKYVPDYNTTADTETIEKRVGPFPDGAECRVQVRSEAGYTWGPQPGPPPNGINNIAYSQVYANIVNHHNDGEEWWSSKLVADDWWRTYGVNGARGARFRIKPDIGAPYSLDVVHFEVEGRTPFRDMDNADWCWDWYGYDIWPYLVVHRKQYMCSIWCDNFRW